MDYPHRRVTPPHDFWYVSCSAKLARYAPLARRRRRHLLARAQPACSRPGVVVGEDGAHVADSCPMASFQRDALHCEWSSCQRSGL